MELLDFFHLLTQPGQAALADAANLSPVEANFLADFTTLSKKHPAALARAALETAILRREAVDKFPLAEKMYFSRQALEQASAHPVAAYRCQRFQGFETLVDLGCSIGSDTLHLAGHAPTLGLDLDPLRLQMAQANLRAAGLAEKASFLQADLRQPLPLALPAQAALFCDPARRENGRRIFSVFAYHPPLDVLLRGLPRCPALGVKISPGVHLEEIANLEVEVEFISWQGELKEAVLWFGPLRSATRRATLLPGEHTLASSQPEPPAQCLPPQTYLYEPDPAVLRAGLVGLLARQLGAAQLDPQIAFLTSASRLFSPFVRTWQIEEWLPFNLKQLRALLRSRNVGRVVVKKRGSPIQPEALIQSLRLQGDSEKTLVLTQVSGKPVVLVCSPGPLPPGQATVPGVES